MSANPDKKIYSGMKAIDDDKAPGVDGYNAYSIIKKAWPLIRNKVTMAVRRFFNTGKIYNAINCTSITLIPKMLNPATVGIQTNSMMHNPIQNHC